MEAERRAFERLMALFLADRDRHRFRGPGDHGASISACS